MELPHDDVIIQKLQDLLKTYESVRHGELEVRLGKFREGQFIPGVDYQYLNELYTAMRESNLFDVLPIENFISKYFGSVRGRFFLNRSVYHQIKTVAQVDVLCENRPYDIRFSLKQEIPTAPVHHVAHWVRVQTRSPLTYDKRWRFDFSKVGEGTSTEEACRIAKNTSFHIELEITPPNQQYETNAILWLGRARDLLGRFEKGKISLPLFTLK
jgi:hypothetical protein